MLHLPHVTCVTLEKLLNPLWTSVSASKAAWERKQNPCSWHLSKCSEKVMYFLLSLLSLSFYASVSIITHLQEQTCRLRERRDLSREYNLGTAILTPSHAMIHSLYSFDLKALFSLFWIMDCRNEKQYTQALQTFMSQNLMWFICQGSPGKKNQHVCPSICCCSVAQWCLTLCDPVDCSTPGFPVLTNSQSLLKIMSIESVIPSNHLVLCHPLLLLPPIFPSSRVFSSESVLCIRWPKHWSFSFSISTSSEYSFRIHWFDLHAI